MCFFSFDMDTIVDEPEFGMGRADVHDWDVAKGNAAFLFIAVTMVAGLGEGRVFLVCLIHCLVCDLLLMAIELCSLLLSACSNDVLVGRGGCTTWGGDGGANPSKARWISIIVSGQWSLKGANKPPIANRKRCHKDQAILLEDGPSFPPTRALTSVGRSPSFMKCHLLSHSIFLYEKWQTIAAIVSAVNLQAFLGWLYGQYSLVHLRPLQVKSAQILVAKPWGRYLWPWYHVW